MPNLKCQKNCGRALVTCQSCKGKPGQSFLGDPLSCRDCDSGLVCPSHGKHWK
jgi:hypothetical protein